MTRYMVNRRASAITLLIALVLAVHLAGCGTKPVQPENADATPQETTAPTQTESVRFIYTLRDTKDKWWDQPYGNGYDNSITRREMYEDHLRQVFELNEEDPIPQPYDFAIQYVQDGLRRHTLRAHYNSFLFYDGPDIVEMDINSTKPIACAYACGDTKLTFFPIRFSAELDLHNEPSREWHAYRDEGETATHTYMEYPLSEGYVLRVTFPDILKKEYAEQSGTGLAFLFDDETMDKLISECKATLVVEDEQFQNISGLVKESIFGKQYEVPAEEYGAEPELVPVRAADLSLTMPDEKMFNLNIFLNDAAKNGAQPLYIIFAGSPTWYGYTDSKGCADAAKMALESAVGAADALVIFTENKEYYAYDASGDVKEPNEEAKAVINSFFEEKDSENLVEAFIELVYFS